MTIRCFDGDYVRCCQSDGGEVVSLLLLFGAIGLPVLLVLFGLLAMFWLVLPGLGCLPGRQVGTSTKYQELEMGSTSGLVYVFNRVLGSCSHHHYAQVLLCQ